MIIIAIGIYLITHPFILIENNYIIKRITLLGMFFFTWHTLTIPLSFVNDKDSIKNHMLFLKQFFLLMAPIPKLIIKELSKNSQKNLKLSLWVAQTLQWELKTILSVKNRKLMT